jgi:hypothetical protein
MSSFRAIFILILVTQSSLVFSRSKTIKKLFHIERSKNKNQVHYEVGISEKCELVDKSLKSYWMDLEEGPNVRTEMAFYQLPAYGVSKQSVKDQEMLFQLKAVEKREFKLIANKVEEQCIVSSFVKYQDKWVSLKKIYVSAESGFISPTVEYIDVFMQNNEKNEIKERIIPL